MFTLKHIALSEFDKNNKHLQALYSIFSETLNKSLTYEAFLVYYLQHQPSYMDISFMQEDKKTIGFICVTFYKQQLENKMYTICRGAIGIKEAYRGGRLPCRELCMKYIHYKIKHPMENMFVTGYIANPIVYAMICKHSYDVYPKAGARIPQSINRFRDEIINFYGFKEKVIAPFILKIHFQVSLSEKDEERIYSSRDKNVKYYINLNPDFQKQVGILTIVPVSWFNIAASAIKIIITNLLKKFVEKNNEIKKLRQSFDILFKPMLKKVLPTLR